MLKAEEENIEETSSEGSGEEAEHEEAKTSMPAARANVTKSSSMKVQATSNFTAPGTKSALNKGNRQAAAAPAKNEEPMKLPSLTSTRGSSIMQEAVDSGVINSANRPKKALQAKFNSSMDVPSNT